LYVLLLFVFVPDWTTPLMSLVLPVSAIAVLAILLFFMTRMQKEGLVKGKGVCAECQSVLIEPV